jgi:Prokaryotic N-terminal methylation motif
MPTDHPRLNRPGFTLIETTLAMVLGSMVLAGCFGVFVAIRKMDSTFETRYQRTSELDITHTVMSRAMLGLQMEETQTTPVTRADSNTNADGDAESEITEPDPRPRLILETDPTAEPDSTGWVPQRLEIVNATPPVPSGLATQAAGWYTMQDKSESLDFSAMDGSQGAVRGVFELRPAGQRERIMQRLGLIKMGDPILKELDASRPTSPASIEELEKSTKPNWTLWWRPILSYEAEQLLYSPVPLSDSTGAPDEIRARLAGAVPLMHGIERCTWELYKGDAYIDTFAGLTMSDLPAYSQFEVILNNSQYASWMFEVDWVLGDDPSVATLASGTEDEADDDTGAGPGAGDNGDVNGSGRPGGRRGGQIDPNATRTVDFSSDS